MRKWLVTIGLILALTGLAVASTPLEFLGKMGADEWFYDKDSSLAMTKTFNSRIDGGFAIVVQVTIGKEDPDLMPGTKYVRVGYGFMLGDANKICIIGISCFDVNRKKLSEDVIRPEDLKWELIVRGSMGEKLRAKALGNLACIKNGIST